MSQSHTLDISKLCTLEVYHTNFYIVLRHLCATPHPLPTWTDLLKQHQETISEGKAGRAIVLVPDKWNDYLVRATRDGEPITIHVSWHYDQLHDQERLLKYGSRYYITLDRESTALKKLTTAIRKRGYPCRIVEEREAILAHLPLNRRHVA